jgi:maltose alpha-D-glucosyltransferase/alpha-amylase
MYRAYAADPDARLRQGIRRRLAPLLGNDRRRIELLYGLMLALPGTPAVYYGDEIGMGDNIYLGDRQGVRTPMQWTAGANAGFSDANPQRLFLPPVTDPEYAYTSVNVAAQDENPRSLLWWMRRMFAQRRRLASLGRGALRLVPSSTRKVLAFVRELGDERVLIVANLSRHAQPARLDLAEWAGMTPVEISGRTAFPTIDGDAWPITLGGHAFFWFTLGRVQPAQASAGSAEDRALPALRVAGPWSSVLRGPAKETLTAILPGFLSTRRWFAGKARQIREVAILDAAPVPLAAGEGWITLIRVAYTEGEEETYALPIAFATGESAGRVRRDGGPALIAEMEADGIRGLLYGAEGDPDLAKALLDAIAHGRRIEAGDGEVVASSTGEFAPRRAAAARRPPSLLSGEQSNSSIRYGDAFMMKLFRKVEPGVNPDLEVGLFLTERAAFPHTPPVCGSIEYRPRRGEPTTLAILQGYVPNEGDAWAFTLDAAGLFFESLVRRPEWRRPPPDMGTLLEEAMAPATKTARALVGPYLEAAALLGTRTAELHRALASDREDPAFAPEPFSPLDRRALYQSQRNLADDSFELLRRRLPELPEAARALAEHVLGKQDAVLERFRRLLDRQTTALRTRTHGDYHLGQVLWTGRDFLIIDFEGEPARPAAIRRAKRSPLRDVAGMLRSFHYAAFQGLATFDEGGALGPGLRETAEKWAALWHGWVSGAFLRAYLEEARGAVFLPDDRGELDDLLVVHILEKAVYELAYELNNRPAWVGLPLQGIAALLKEKP